MDPSILILSDVRMTAKSVAVNVTVPSGLRGMFMATNRCNIAHMVSWGTGVRIRTPARKLLVKHLHILNSASRYLGCVVYSGDSNRHYNTKYRRKYTSIRMVAIKSSYCTIKETVS